MDGGEVAALAVSLRIPTPVLWIGFLVLLIGGGALALMDATNFQGSRLAVAFAVFGIVIAGMTVYLLVRS